MTATERFLAIACVRNEGGFLVDWIAHHRAVGFTDFLIYSNDCQDGTDALLDRLDAAGVVHHRRNPGPYKGGIQFTAMKAAAREAVYHAADWVMPLDLDEYLNIHVGGHGLADLVAALPGMDACSVTWRMFGNAGVRRFDPAPVTTQFTRAAPEIMLWPWRAFLFKTLYRRPAFDRPGIHRPVRKKGTPLPGWFDGQGRRLPDRFIESARTFAFFGQPIYRLAQINHYALQSAENYLLKVDRGRAVHADETLGLDYWIERNWNQVDDTTIARYAPAATAERDRLRAVADVAELSEAAVNWRKTRIETLLEDRGNREFFAKLLMLAPSLVVPPDVAMLMHSAENGSKNASFRKDS